MSPRTPGERARTLRDLHRPGAPLILANAWDAGSARVVEAAGFAAVATGSAAVAATLGYDDGEAAPVTEVLGAVARIAAAVAVPVTADLEHGYSMGPAELVERLAGTGAVGCNLEDSDPRTNVLVAPAEQADFLAAIRAAARQAGVDLVLNARIDTYLYGTGTPEQRLAETLQRARAYLAAGVDCVYPILAADPAAIGTLVEEVGCPVNVLFRTATPAGPGTPSLAELAGLGVARISFGDGLHHATQAYLARMVAEIARGGDPYRTR